jgi:hypothetical protein
MAGKTISEGPPQKLTRNPSLWPGAVGVSAVTPRAGQVRHGQVAHGQVRSCRAGGDSWAGQVGRVGRGS